MSFNSIASKSTSSSIQLFDNPTLEEGVVTKKNRENFEVRAGEQTFTCVLSPRLLKEFSYAKSGGKARDVRAADTSPIAVGDRVRFETNNDGAAGNIIEILPRQNQLSRQSAVPMPGALPFEQVIAANLSLVVPVFAAASPTPKWNMLDRYLVTAEALELPALICITKIDLVKDEDGRLDEEIREQLEDYRRIGYRVIMVSAVTGEGLDELREALQGNTSVLLGKSGVGKTSLLNALQPGLGLRVNAISRATGKGKHTTTHLEMFPIGPDSAIVDTPGVREFGLWEIEADDLAVYFPEMRPYLGRCKFGLDCRHDEEPGCAVRKAVMQGLISPRRYQSYMRLQEDL